MESGIFGHSGFGAVRRAWVERQQNSEMLFHESVEPGESSDFTPLELLKIVDQSSIWGANASLLMRSVAQQVKNQELHSTLDSISVASDLPITMVWALLLDWLGERLEHHIALSARTRSLLRVLLKATARGSLKRQARTARAQIEETYAAVTAKSWDWRKMHTS